MDSHIERLGRPRVWIGGGSMYLAIPMFAAVRAGIAVSLDRIVAPALGLRVTPAGRYIVLDRHQIEGLSWFDAFNCDYCAYANGVTMQLHARLDELARHDAEVSAPKRIALGAVAAVTAAALWPWQSTFIRFVYGVLISRPLGLHRMSRAEADAQLDEVGYAGHLPTPARKLLRRQKRFALQLLAALEQIESGWCPLKHLDRSPDKIYPEHHRRFFAPDQIEALRCTLRTEGTVSAMKPTVAGHIDVPLRNLFKRR